MDGKTLPRIGAIAFVAVATTISVIQVRQAPGTEAEAAPIATVVSVDPLRTELLHCQSIGQTGASDPACLQAWAINRHRFLSAGGRAAQTPPVAPAASDVPRPAVADQGNAVTNASDRGER